mgnify:CR=1 FL=1|jgi:hypothetical protein
MAKIVCAAIKFTSKADEDNIVVLPCIRHGDRYKQFAYLNFVLAGNYFRGDWNKEEGFIDNNGKFHSRKEAFQLVKGSLPASLIYFKEQREETELYSEDLY